jgi:hypothetical protein
MSDDHNSIGTSSRFHTLVKVSADVSGHVESMVRYADNNLPVDNNNCNRRSYLTSIVPGLGYDVETVCNSGAPTNLRTTIGNPKMVRRLYPCMRNNTFETCLSELLDLRRWSRG